LDDNNFSEVYLSKLIESRRVNVPDSKNLLSTFRILAGNEASSELPLKELAESIGNNGKFLSGITNNVGLSTVAYQVCLQIKKNTMEELPDEEEKVK
jgi:hypothetical protein